MTPSRPANDGPSLHGFDVAAEFLQRLAAGATIEDLLREPLGISVEDLRACFAYAAEALANVASPPTEGGTIDWVAANVAESATLPPAAVAEAATLPPTANATPASLAKRVTLPGYEIFGKLGEGGMGVVYKARHLRLNRLVAIKMILAGEHASEEMIARFALEAEAVAQLQHPGIVQIHEIGEHEGHSFLALEYVPGGSLAARLDDKPWSAAKAAELVETLARAMQAAHDHGIVHRDLKPENVLLDESSDTAAEPLTPKITDFGLAKRLQETTGRTRTGEIMGTPSYMAPEQAAGKRDIGPATDIYALGAILYRMLAGRPPFLADTALDMMMLVLEQEPTPLRALNKTLPRDLETVALKCLAKEPAKRYVTAAELAGDLRRFLDGEPIKARRLSVVQRLDRWCRKRPGAALARGILVLLVVLALLISSLYGTKLLPVTGLGWLGSTLLFFAAVARTKVRPFLIGLSISLVLAILTITCVVTEPSWFRIPSTGIWRTPKFILPGLTADNSAKIVCLLLLLLGLVPGVLANWRWRIVGSLTISFLLLASLQWPESGMFLIWGVLPGLYFGILCRIVRWYREGNLLDTFVGSIWGAMLGYVLGAFFLGILVVGLIGHQWEPGTFANKILDAAPTFAGVLGTVLGAYFGASIGKKTARRVHG
jgi:tRNA A-37 threonylcarbamoyl transferase component Bud32